ncbi:MAG: hypothetical protein ACOY5W_10090 [Pseudomonadota bacterium]
MEEYAMHCAKWLERRVREAEANDPKLRPLKDRINQLSNKLKLAAEHEIPGLLREQSQAIEGLMLHVSHPRKA